MHVYILSKIKMREVPGRVKERGWGAGMEISEESTVINEGCYHKLKEKLTLILSCKEVG